MKPYGTEAMTIYMYNLIQAAQLWSNRSDNDFC